MNKIERIAQRLQQLREADPQLRVFGAATHRYQLAPAMPEIGVTSMERALGIRLPDEYRQFLLQIGSSGAGPGYGLLPLQPLLLQGFPQVTSTITLKDGSTVSSGTGPRQELARVSNPAKPFPLAGPINPSKQNVELPPDTNPYDGCVKLGEIGCGYFYFLVVTGPQSGQVWVDYSAGNGDVAPVGAAFLDWYEHWLSENLFNAAVQSMRTQMLDDVRWTPKPEVLRFAPVIEESLSRWPDHPYIQDGAAILRLYERKFEESVALFEKASAGTEGQAVDAELGLCAAYRFWGKPEKIAGVLDRAWKRNPIYFPHTYALKYWKAVSHRMLGRHDDALQAAEDAANTAISYELAYLEQAIIHAARKHMAGVDGVVQKIASLNFLQRYADDAHLIPQQMPREERVRVCYWALSNVLAQNGLEDAAKECRAKSGY